MRLDRDRGVDGGVGNTERVRARVGAVHLPLGRLFDAFTSAGFAVDQFQELGREDDPHVVALRARLR